MENSVEWHFIPYSSPYFGRIREAIICSTKYHLKRVIGNILLSFEELSTSLAQIELLLNSQLLIHLNDNDCDCINVLIPSHFLTSDVLQSVPEESTSIVTSPKNHWELLQNMSKGLKIEARVPWFFQKRTKRRTASSNIHKKTNSFTALRLSTARLLVNWSHYWKFIQKRVVSSE